MDILVLTSTFPRWKNDTTPSFVFDLAKILVDKGINNFILAPHYEGASRYEIMYGISVYRFFYFYPFKYEKLAYNGGILFNLRRSFIYKLQAPLLCLSEFIYSISMIFSKDIKLINSHWLLPQGLIGAICGIIFNMPHIVTVHGSDINTTINYRILKKIANFIFINSSQITVNSRYTKNMVLSVNKNVENKIQVIPMGVNLSRFTNYDTSFLKNKFKSNNIILSVGRLVEWKGIKYLVESMKIVTEVFKDAILVIGGDGPERSNLENLVKNLSLTKNIVFVGNIAVEDLPKYYSSSSVFVLPSIQLNGQTEALGVVLLEAMACKTPVIGSNVGGIPDIIEDDYNGFLIAERSPMDIAEKIIKLLDDEVLANKFRLNGFKTVDEKFSSNYVAETFIKMYKEAL